MAYFRNFGNVVSSHLFTKPNNLLLRSCNLPKILCESVDSSINHLHSAKALVQTISTLRNFEQNTEGQFKEQIQSELNYLETCRSQYKTAVRKYVQSAGILTAEGIANLYAVGEELGLSNAWLQKHVEAEIPNKAEFMSRSNLKDVLQALQKSNPNVSLLQKYLSQKQTAEPDYVARIGNETNQFEYVERSKSSNWLINALESGRSYPVYFAGKWGCLIWSRVMSYVAGPHHYNLHQY